MILLMGLFSRIFGRHKKVNVLTTLDRDAGLFRIDHDIPVQLRRAQSIPDLLRERLIALCEADNDVISCTLLDVRDKKIREMKLFVSLELDHPGALHRIGPQMQAIFRDFPEYAGKYFIGDQPFGKLDPEIAAYNRTA